MLSYDKSTIMNPGWMDTKYPLPQSKDKSSAQFVDVGQGMPSSSGSSYAGSYSGGHENQTKMDFATKLVVIGVPVSAVLGVIVGALVGNEYPYFYGAIGFVAGPFIALVLFVIGSAIYFILALIFDWF